MSINEENSIETFGLARSFEIYEKPAGLKASLRGFFDRKYQTKHALRPTTLSIQHGQIVGLVGANGAGKTTLIKLLCGLIHPSSGDAKVLGYHPWERKPEFLQQVGVLLGQKNQLWWDIAPADSFELLGQIYMIPGDELKSRMGMLAERLGATKQLYTQLRRLSLGERMKMEIIGALLHKPKILFLDEPTIGLDIVAQSAIRSFLIEYSKAEKPTIILTSHYMDDIAQLADRLLLVSQGSFVFDGTVKEFTSQAKVRHNVTLKFEQPLTTSYLTPITKLRLDAGVQSFEGEILSDELSDLMLHIVNQTKILEMQVEQTNFEDVIHDFLAKDHGGR